MSAGVAQVRLIDLGIYSFNGRRHGVSARASSGMRAWGRAFDAAVAGDHARAQHELRFYSACAGFEDRRGSLS